jgi:acetyl esterase/lipase
MILGSNTAVALRRMLLAGSVLAGPGLAVPAAAQTVTDQDAMRFGVRESVLHISLSPSGKRIAYISAGPQHTEILNVIDLEGDATPRKVTANAEIIADLDSCSWANDVQLVCQASGMLKRPDGVLLPFDRLFSVNADTGAGKELSKRQSYNATGLAQNGGDVLALDVGGEQGRILISSEAVPESDLRSRMTSKAEGLGAEIVEIATGNRSTRERFDPLARYYLADSVGNIRIKRRMSMADGRLTGESDTLFRLAGDKEWKPLDNLTIDGKAADFYPSAVDGIRNVVIGFVSKDGYDAIAEFPLDGTGAGKVLMSRGDVDVDALIRIGRQRRVVGASYATEKREIAYFDEGLAKLARSLGKALPDQPLINVVGASADEKQLLIVASSDTQPGVVYLYDQTARTLEPLMQVREQLEGVRMGQMRPVTYPARDGTQIPAYLTLPPGSDGKNLPAIVMPHGGPSARDEWGFDWLVQYFVAKGYAVLQPNYRGSAGYGENWYGKNGFKAWETAIGDVNDAGRWLVSQGIGRADRLAIVGWSYGGYAALQSQVLDPSLFKAVVAIAPVVDLDYIIQDARNYTNSRLVERFVGTGPHIEAGSPRRQAARFEAPVALYHGTLDLNVDVRHSQDMAKALKAAGKSVVYHEYKDLQHDLGDSGVRAAMLADIGQFLETSMKSN